MTVLFSLGLLAAPAWPANDFTGDPNCAALWRFNTYYEAFLADSIGTNTLSIATAGGPGVNTVDYQEGSASADFQPSPLKKHLYINDPDLDAGFPLKNGDMNRRISVAAWFRLESVPAVNQSFRILEKSGGYNQNSFFIAIVTDLNDETWFYLGIGTGASAYWVKFAPAPLVADRWYHFGVTYVYGYYRIRIWDATDGALVGGVEQTGTTFNNIYVGTGSLLLGVHNIGTYWQYDGLLDELVVFNDILSADEIDLIRAGTYGN